jgi:hypothetical protein
VHKIMKSGEMGGGERRGGATGGEACVSGCHNLPIGAVNYYQKELILFDSC